MKRKAISTRTRLEVFKRDGFRCMYCGRTPPTVLLHVDHIIAVSNGGSNCKDNLATSCDQCNLGKSNVPLTSVPKSLQERAAESIEREKQLKALAKTMKSERDRIKRDAAEILSFLEVECGAKASAADLRSVEYFVERMPSGDVQNAMGSAIRRHHGRSWARVFKCFCAICWAVLKGKRHD